jgi:hypothetical protein
MSRPSLMWSTVRAMSANRSGLRKPMPLTNNPIWARVVISAPDANAVQPSKLLTSG